MVWRPGQATPIHDHVTWCAFGVLQGAEREERYLLGEHGDLEPSGVTTNIAGDVTGLAPPGDIHRVRNAAAQTAISLHIYGTDVSRLGSSVRRTYDAPVAARPRRLGDARRALERTLVPRQRPLPARGSA